MRPFATEKLKSLQTVPGFRYANAIRRAGIVGAFCLPKLWQAASWVVASREDTNYTYSISDRNLAYLAHAVSLVTGAPYELTSDYVAEAREDERLRTHVIRAVRQSPYRERSDARCEFGRRLGWYAFARVLKPRLIVETGVDKGHGAVLLCAALLRNAEEGSPGRYCGTDINPRAGWLLSGAYKTVGEILYGDSITSLKKLGGPVDLFINDSDHSADYEYQEYKTIEPKLSPGAVILGDNTRITEKLAVFSRETGRAFLYFQDEPEGHWYPGAGIGISFFPRR
ncbi:MAG: class I SAM-dependent methyltransferase [Candidatus Korobacteraceae bacterium]